MAVHQRGVAQNQENPANVQLLTLKVSIIACTAPAVAPAGVPVTPLQAVATVKVSVLKLRWILVVGWSLWNLLKVLKSLKRRRSTRSQTTSNPANETLAASRKTKQLENTYFIANKAFIQPYSTSTRETIYFFISPFYNAQIWHLLLKFYALDLFPAQLVFPFIVLEKLIKLIGGNIWDRRQWFKWSMKKSCTLNCPLLLKHINAERI